MTESMDEQVNKNGNRRGMNPNSRKNLEKRNNKGNNNAKGLTITSAIRGMLDKPCDERWLYVEDKGKGITWRQAIAKSLLSHAVQGKQGAVSELLDRLEGKVTQPLGGEGGGPVTIRVVYDDRDGRKGIHGPAETATR